MTDILERLARAAEERMWSAAHSTAGLGKLSELAVDAILTELSTNLPEEMVEKAAAELAACEGRTHVEPRHRRKARTVLTSALSVLGGENGK